MEIDNILLLMNRQHFAAHGQESWSRSLSSRFSWDLDFSLQIFVTDPLGAIDTKETAGSRRCAIAIAEVKGLE